MRLPHQSLVAWQRADDLVLRIYKLTRACFPDDERFALTSQTRRAALSVPLNIVEGFARRHTAERLQFLRTSWASLAELDYCLHVARRLNYIPAEQHEGMLSEVQRVAAPLKGLIDQVAARLPNHRPR